MSGFSLTLNVPFGRFKGWLAGRVRQHPPHASRILAHCESEGIRESEAVALVVAEDRIDPNLARRTLAQIFAKESPDDATIAMEIAHVLEERTGERLDFTGLTTTAGQIGSALARAVGTMLGVGCLYLVLGGLLEGQGERFGGLSGPVSLVFFLAALAFLGLFEALHTSVTQLRLADLRGLAQTHPRACELHRRFRDDLGISRVLAGRQIVVVITVFIVAGLSSFPHMQHLPLTDTAVPAGLRPAIELGIPGAMVVLWIAQLAPQFYATRHAVALMNTRAAAWALDLAFGLEAMGIAHPSRWLVRSEQEPQPIPISPALQWEQAAEGEDGEGLLSVVRRWRSGEDGAKLEATATTVVRGRGRSVVNDSSLVLPGSPSSLSISADITRLDGMPRPAAPTAYEEESLRDGDSRLHKPVAPAVGSFVPGDRVRVVVDAEYNAAAMRDVIHIGRRPRFLLWRLELDEHPQRIGPVRIRGYRLGSDELSAIGTAVRLEPDKRNPHEPPAYSYALPFPPPNTVFVFDWEVVWG